MYVVTAREGPAAQRGWARRGPVEVSSSSSGASRNVVGVGVVVTGVLLGVIAVLVLGLPLLALGVDRVLPQLKGRPVAPDPVQVLARRHHLAPRDLIEVQAAVTEGRAARPRRLAAAAVDHASHVAGLDMWDRPQARERLVSARLRPVLAVVWVVLALGYLVNGIVSGDDNLIVLWVVYLAAACVVVPLQRRAWRRRTAAARAAIAANDTTSVETTTGDRQ